MSIACLSAYLPIYLEFSESLIKRTTICCQKQISFRSVWVINKTMNVKALWKLKSTYILLLYFIIVMRAIYPSLEDWLIMICYHTLNFWKVSKYKSSIDLQTHYSLGINMQQHMEYCQPGKLAQGSVCRVFIGNFVA